MKLSGQVTIQAPRQDVWDIMFDLDAMTKIIPGTESLTQLSEGEFEGLANIGVGPVKGTYTVRVTMLEQTPPSYLRFQIEGKGAQGFGQGVGTVRLTEQDGTTIMEYDGEGQIGGRVATVGQRLIEPVARTLINQGVEAMISELQARRLAAAGQAVPWQLRWARWRPVVYALAALLALVVALLLFLQFVR